MLAVLLLSASTLCFGIDKTTKLTPDANGWLPADQTFQASFKPEEWRKVPWKFKPGVKVEKAKYQ